MRLQIKTKLILIIIKHLKQTHAEWLLNNCKISYRILEEDSFYSTEYDKDRINILATKNKIENVYLG